MNSVAYERIYHFESRCSDLTKSTSRLGNGPETKSDLVCAVFFKQSNKSSTGIFMLGKVFRSILDYLDISSQYSPE